MKIAVTSTGNSLDSRLDLRFGRCEYFVFYDTGSGAVEFVPNPNKDVQEGAGIASVHLVAARKAEKIVSGEFGLKIKPLLDGLQIQLIVLKEPEMKIRNILEMLNH